MGPTCPLGIARFVTVKAKLVVVIFWPYNKSFIDQACSVKMTGYWPRSFFRVFIMDLDFVSAHKNAKNNLPSHLDGTSLVINTCIRLTNADEE